jgi:hypothetical protein
MRVCRTISCDILTCEWTFLASSLRLSIFVTTQRVCNVQTSAKRKTEIPHGARDFDVGTGESGEGGPERL